MGLCLDKREREKGCVCARVYVCVCVCGGEYVCVFVCMHICMSVRVYTSLRVCMCTSMNVCTCECAAALLDLSLISQHAIKDIFAVCSRPS